MKPVVASLVVLSLGANAVLAWKLLAPTSAGQEGGGAPAQVAEGQSTQGGSAAATAAKSSAAAAGQVPGGSWAALTAGEGVSSLAARLRAAGYPAHIVRTIVAARISEQYADRMKALGPIQPAEYWATRTLGMSSMDPKALAARRELSREMTDQLKAVLGADGDYALLDNSLYARRQYGNLSPQKLAAVQQIQQDYSELQSQVRNEGMGMTLREDREKLAYLEAERRKDLATVMTPQELDEYLMRSSNSAQLLRAQSTGFEPTEQEFRALYKLQEAYDVLYGTYGTAPRVGVEAAQARSAASQKLLEDSKALLGPERGAEFERARDGAYQGAYQVAKRMDLPVEVAATVYDLSKETQARAQAIRSNQSLTAPQRQEQLAALSTEANQKSAAVLGERGHAAYLDSGGYWLRNIAPQPAPAGAAGASGRGGGGAVIIREGNGIILR